MGKRRRDRLALMAVLCAELLIAGWWRWDHTRAVIQTPFDYGTGHVVVVSEHWRQQGAWRQHFLPVLSTDPRLPEWPYRTEFSQEYYSVPPLAFILHYGATRLLDSVEPVLLGKVLAQCLIAASVLGAAYFLYVAFGAWPSLIGLSFLIWGVPFVLWFANGYFAVNVGLAVQLVFVSWCAAVAVDQTPDRSRHRRQGLSHMCVGAALAFLGGFSDYLPLVANAVAVVGLLAIAAYRGPTTPSSASRRRVVGAAGGVLIGSVAAVLCTVGLYARQMGLARYRRALVTRVADRSGHAVFAEHVDVIRRQMLTAWPPSMLVGVSVMFCVVAGWCVVTLLTNRARARITEVIVVPFVLTMSLLPSLLFHYRAVNYVRIHWWFSGTWTIGWAMTICSFVWIVGRLTASVGPSAGVRARYGYVVFCTLLLASVIGMNVAFARAQSGDDPRAPTVRLYRALGHDLPRDTLPLVVIDVTTDRPGLFEDFPFATAYLRRPVLFGDGAGHARLPQVDELYLGQPVRFGGEDASQELLRRGGDVYIVYDPDARDCDRLHVPVSDWMRAMPLQVCRTSATDLVQHADAVLRPLSPRDECDVPPLPPTDLQVVANGGRRVTLRWNASLTARATYDLEAGTAPLSSEVLQTNVGRTTTFLAVDVKPATYYVRLRGRNACGTGDHSNEVVVVVR